MLLWKYNNKRRFANMADEYYNPNTNPQGDAPQQNTPPQQDYQAAPQQNYQQQGYQQPQQGYQQQNYQQQNYQAGPQPNYQQPFNQMPNQPFYPPQEEKANVGLAVLSFFFPIVGLIIYLVKKDDKPKTAKLCGKCALISFIFNIVLVIISNVLAAVVGTSLYYF